MMILTLEQMSHAAWECDLHGFTLFDGLQCHAILSAEGLARCAEGDHCDDMRGKCVYCGKSF